MNTIPITSYSAEIIGEIERFFEAFSMAFCEFNGALIAQRYTTPYIALNAEGTVQAFTTQEQIGLYFQGCLDKYYEQGCLSCRFKELQVVPLGQMSVLASVTWELLSHDQKIISTWRESYNLTRSGNAFRIYASTDHVAPE